MSNTVKVAVLDDWQGVARANADWAKLEARADLTIFPEAFADEDDAVAKLADFEIVLSMRERTPLPASLINRLPKLRMLGMTGARNASLDNVIWWMKQSGADGLRLDAIKHVEGSWLTGVRQRLLAEIEPGKQQHVWLVGETFDGDKGFIKSFVDPCAKLDGQFDFPLRAQLLTNLLLGQGKMTDLKGFLDANDGYYGPDAIMSSWQGGRQRCQQRGRGDDRSALGPADHG